MVSYVHRAFESSVLYIRNPAAWDRGYAELATPNFRENLFSDVGCISPRGGVGKVKRGSVGVPRPVITLKGDDESTMNLSRDFLEPRKAEV
jgi:hypothetical protein